MRFLFQYPDRTGPDGDLLDAGSVADVARAAEAAGFDGLSFTEHPVPSAKWLENGGHQTLDPFIALANAAAVTERLQLVTFLSVVGYRNPSLLAKTVASVDKVSNGRMVLGAGTGYLRSEFRALGVDFEERNELFDEALDLLPLHWSGEPFSFEGKHFTVKDAVARPRPVRQPVPIWIGGNSQKALRRVAEKAQGWMPMLAGEQVASTARTPFIGSVDDLGVKVEELRAMAGERGPSLDVVVSYNPGGSLLSEVDRHQEAFEHLESIGATWVLVSLPGSTWSATRDFIDGFGSLFLSGST